MFEFSTNVLKIVTQPFLMKVPTFKWPTSVGGAAGATKTWSSHFTFGNTLAVLSIGIPLVLGTMTFILITKSDHIHVMICINSRMEKPYGL